MFLVLDLKTKVHTGYYSWRVLKKTIKLDKRLEEPTTIPLRIGESYEIKVIKVNEKMI